MLNPPIIRDNRFKPLRLSRLN